jgi:Uma2 family endonuclease
MSPPAGSHIENGLYLTLDTRSVELTDDQFFRLCSDNPELQFELSAERKLIIMSPGGKRTSWRNAKINQRLANWSDQDGTGIFFESNAIFTLPNGAKRSPDASWMPMSRWDQLSEEEQEDGGVICPDFVVELRSRTDRLPRLLKKMDEYVRNGARLGWLLDPYERRVHIYKPGEPPAIEENPEYIAGDPVLPGFRFNFREILRERPAKS